MFDFFLSLEILRVFFFLEYSTPDFFFLNLQRSQYAIVVAPPLDIATVCFGLTAIINCEIHPDRRHCVH